MQGLSIQCSVGCSGTKNPDLCAPKSERVCYEICMDAEIFGSDSKRCAREERQKFWKQALKKISYYDDVDMEIIQNTKNKAKKSQLKRRYKKQLVTGDKFWRTEEDAKFDKLFKKQARERFQTFWNTVCDGSGPNATAVCNSTASNFTITSSTFLQSRQAIFPLRVATNRQRLAFYQLCSDSLLFPVENNVCNLIET